MSERDPDWLMGALAAQAAYRGGWPEEYGPPAPADPWAPSMAGAKEVGRSLIDMARTAPGHAARGLMSGIASLGVPGDPIPFGDTSEEFDRRGLEGAQAARKQLETATYEPQTMAGHYMGSVAEIMGNPLNWAGPGGAAAKAAWNVASGIGGETGAQAAKGTPYEGAARLAGSFSPLALERGWQATGPAVRAMAAAPQLGAIGGVRIQPQPAAPMGELAQPFYSAAEQAVAGAKMAQAPAAQWLGTLRNAPGVKPEELQRLGLENWLAQQPGAVPKQAVADYVAANKVNLDEKVRGFFPDVVKRRTEVQNELNDIQQRLYRLQERPVNTFHPDDLAERNALIARKNELIPEHGRLSTQLETSAPKFMTYQLPGGENYRETLLTLPNARADAINARMNAITQELHSPGEVPNWSELRGEYKKLADQLREMQTFSGSHWDEPNVLAHYRTNDRTIGGKKTLFLEEVQSDWHQAGRKQGYQGAPRTVPEPTPTGDPAADALARVEAGIGRYDPGVPDAPFKTTWPELTLKRAIREAAEGGYDQIAWTPGKVQNERYQLSNHLKELQYIKRADGSYEIAGTRKDGGGFNHPGAITADQLPNVVGQEMAEKIVKGEGSGARGWPSNMRSLSGIDLEVGGEGMKGFYDKMLPAAANKIGKKHGAQVGQAEMFEGSPEKWVPFQRDDGVWQLRNANDGFEASLVYPTREAALADMRRGPKHSVHTLPITPQLRETALRKGFPLFQLGAGGVGLGALAAQDRYQPNEL